MPDVAWLRGSVTKDMMSWKRGTWVLTPATGPCWNWRKCKAVLSVRSCPLPESTPACRYPDQHPAQSIPRGCAWIKDTTSLGCAASWTSSVSPPTSALEAKRLRPSNGRPDSKPGARWWTHSQLAEPIPAHPGALGQVSRQLHRLSSFRLRPHRPQSCRVIRIGS